MIDAQVAWDKLCSFDTPEELKSYFVSERVMGLRYQSTSCPIAVWMTDQVGALTSVADRIRVGVSHQYPFEPASDGFQTLMHNPATFDFIRNFDDGLYPELDVERTT